MLCPLKQNFKLTFKSVINEVFTFITLQTKTFTVVYDVMQEIAGRLFIYATCRTTHRNSN